jgi:hypothetical protein
MRKITLLIMLILNTAVSNAQEEEHSNRTCHFSGNVSITNNGFSFIPLFSLDKPAFVSELSMGGERFSFDPQFRFDLAGLKPWSFIFIWRYQLIQTEHFQVKLGVHLPAISFRTFTYESDGETKEKLAPYRFITPELTPTYTFSRHFSVGMYYIYGIGLEKEDQTRNTHFVSFRAYFSQLHLTRQLYLNFNPQVYYLYMDGFDGFYAAYSLSLGHQKIPVSISTMMNFKLRSEVESKDFDWNISLTYSFDNQFVKK